MKWKFNKIDWKAKQAEMSFELKYHKYVLSFLSKAEKITYITRHVFGRDCTRGKHCLGQASLKELDTRHLNEMSNHVFYCDKCHKEASKILEKFWTEYTPKIGPALPEEEPDEKEVDTALMKENAVIAARRRERKQYYKTPTIDE